MSDIAYTNSFPYDSGEASSSPESALHRPHVLIATAVDAEREAVLRGLGQDGRFDVVAVGVGPAAAAAYTARALARHRYGLVISAGIGGGFAGQAAIGSLVIANAIVAADLGSETPDGFLSVQELGFGTDRIVPDADLSQRWMQALERGGLSAYHGPILTVSTTTGSAESAAFLARRIPGAAAEGMEGFGVATAAAAYELPALEIRAISNAVGPRNRGAWKIKEALEALEAASSHLLEVLT
ncbi:futalosine hydrolase [Paenibacillus campinasensis]|uniref:Futalosine hydrolase n=1 Tax=Paenibacillus campinasensis TaxID=66347 RepID=A0A268EJ07_9BACL|nr:futalosine hydrolase [Paenibacillus campinasensis]PAD73118.1 futalosine hydrolase [Paenibacillus campinasensis]